MSNIKRLLENIIVDIQSLDYKDNIDKEVLIQTGRARLAFSESTDLWAIYSFTENHTMATPEDVVVYDIERIDISPKLNEFRIKMLLLPPQEALIAGVILDDKCVNDFITNKLQEVLCN